MNYFKSDSAIITNCDIGKDVKIWNYANLYGCTIGEKSTIGSYTEIQSDVIIGKNVTISSHSFICSLVRIENDVFIGHGVMFINDKFSDNKVNYEGPYEETLIEDNVIIGSNSTILPVKISSGVIIGAGSVVTKDLDMPGKYAGNPAKKNISRPILCS